MKLVWIEDFGGEQRLGSSYYQNLFGPIVQKDFPEEIFDNLKISEIPEALGSFFGDHSSHSILVLLNYFEYENYILDCEENHYGCPDADLFLVDIRLDERVGDITKSIPLTDIAPLEFHQKAGLYIFNDLIRRGVDPSRIVFFSANVQTLEPLKEFQKAALAPLPQALSKGDIDKGALESLFRELLNDRYLFFRRSIIDACAYLLRFLSSIAPEKGVFGNGFIKQDPKAELIVSKEEVSFFLESLPRLLPLRLPSGEGPKKQIFRTFAQFLIQSWDKLHPGNGALLSRKNFVGLGWSMRTLRILLMHSSYHPPLEERHLAYCFLVHIRILFPQLPASSQSFEKPLLEFFRRFNPLPPTRFSKRTAMACFESTRKEFEKYRKEIEVLNKAPLPKKVPFNKMLTSLHLINKISSHALFNGVFQTPFGSGVWENAEGILCVNTTMFPFLRNPEGSEFLFELQKELIPIAFPDTIESDQPWLRGIYSDSE